MPPPIRDVLVHLDPGPGPGPRLEAALALARASGARVVAFRPVVEPAAPLIELPPVRLFRERREAEADRVLAAAATRAAQAGVALEAWRETAPLDRLPGLFARRARCADLAIVGPPEAGPDAEGVGVPALTEMAFLATGRPALVVPPAGARALPPAGTLVAWDGSREAARAVHDALPLLLLGRPAARVSVVVADPEGLGEQVGEEPGADLAAHLARHGLAAVGVATLPGGGRGTGEALLARAAAEGADLLVMGGYGHPRLREVVLGGTTRHVLAHATLPVLLSH